ncbi:MAG: hypothetical protein H6925_05395 [Holosporaceae bacterium]|nr:MAG: hypothetical protein H6925_05395 [Holosporaceae bacterium]
MAPLFAKNEALQSKLSVNSTTTLFELATLGAGIISCAAETNALYEGNLVRILPDVKAPHSAVILPSTPIHCLSILRKLNHLKI